MRPGHAVAENRTLSSAETAGDWRQHPVAVMVSGGPDSAILVAELAATSPRVVPIFIRFGLFWDAMEEAAVRQFVAALSSSRIADPIVLDLPLQGVYGRHWSNTGENVPDEHSPDSAVHLPGRNLLVLLQAAIWCRLNAVSTIALGLLKGNPFPDATDAFFASYENALNLGLEGKLRLVRPYAHLTKTDVIQRGQHFPLGLTWSCMKPVGQLHCGKCNKCAERQRAFAAAGVADPTSYTGSPSP
jgi:7-cyano-7-deazaguanine synthase